MTIIQIKYSSANTAPANGSLTAGELAYSEVSKKLLIGNEYSGEANVIGGQFYTDLINSNTSLSVANTIVVRDSQGSFSANVITANTFVGTISGNLNGNSVTTNRLLNPFVITLGSDASGNISIDGSANVTLNVELTNSGVSSGTYGNTRFIPTFTVGTDGRITGVSNVAIDFPDAANFSQASYNQANSSYLHANAAFAAANTALNSNAHANAAFDVANTANTTATSSSSYSNSAFAVANTANTTATAASSYANSAYQIANSASSYANGAFVAANTGLLSFGHANAAFNIANTAITNSVNTSLLLTEIFANVTATETQIQTAGNYANAAYRHANAAYINSNTKFNSSGGTISGDVNVTGNLTISGNVTYVATNQLNLGDAIITLNADLGQAATPTENAGIEIERGNQANASIIWNETVDRWQFTGNTGTSNIASDAAESYANSSFEAANAAFAFSGQTQILVLGAAIAANAGGSYANSAFLRANSAFNGTSGSHSNAAYAHANAAFTVANASGLLFVTGAYTHANAAFDAANNAYESGGIVAGGYANSAYLKANAAYTSQNTTGVYANTSYRHANSGYEEANSATLIALAAYALANSIQVSEGSLIANAAFIQANAAFVQANVSGSYANSAYTQANVGFSTATAASSYANGAFTVANTKLSAAGGTISGDLTVSGNLRVDGDRATFLVSSISIEDNLVDIASDQTGTPTLNAGLRVVRGDESAVQFRWNESLDRWQYTIDGSAFINVGAESDGLYANAAYAVANTANAHSISAHSKANTANSLAQAAYDTANNAGSSTILQAAFQAANSASSYANGAFGAANSAGSFANSALASATTADQRSTIVGIYANGAFEIANVANEKAASGWRHANSSYIQANAAFSAANNKLDLSGGTINGALTVQGSVTVIGGLLYANSSTVLLADNIVTLNAAINQSSAPEFNAGIEIDRGSSDNVSLLWNESVDSWQFTNDGTNYINIASSSAGTYANAAFLTANSALSYANGAFEKSNTNTLLAQAAFDKANTGNLTAQAAFNRANSAYELANGKSTFAFSSFPPGDPKVGDRWIDSDLGQEFIYINDGDSSQWIELSAFVDQNLVDDNIYYVLEDDHLGTDLNTVQSIYGVSITLGSNAVYEFEASFALKKTSGTNPHSIELGFAGTSSINHILYHVNYNGSALNTISTPTSIMINSISNTTVSSNTNVSNHNIFIKGMISVGSGGTFTPQYRLSDVTGGAFSTLAGSYFKMEPVGAANTNINVGTWS